MCFVLFIDAINDWFEGFMVLCMSYGAAAFHMSKQAWSL